MSGFRSYWWYIILPYILSSFVINVLRRLWLPSAWEQVTTDRLAIPFSLLVPTVMTWTPWTPNKSNALDTGGHRFGQYIGPSKISCCMLADAAPSWSSWLSRGKGRYLLSIYSKKYLDEGEIGCVEGYRMLEDANGCYRLWTIDHNWIMKGAA